MQANSLEAATARRPNAYTPLAGRSFLNREPLREGELRSKPTQNKPLTLSLWITLRERL